jgi:hypothetical protein
VPTRLSLPVRVIPRAPSDRLDGRRAGRVLVRVTAAPAGGAANRAVQAVVASALGVRAADVRIERGALSRDKLLSVPSSAAPALARLLK